MRLFLTLTLLTLLPACSKTDPKATATCEQAADKWVSCTRELLGDEMAQVAASKRDVAACASDPKTVALWEACLPKPCDQLMDCLDAQVQASP